MFLWKHISVWKLILFDVFEPKEHFYCFINCNNAKLNASVSGGMEQRRQTPQKTDEAALAKPPSEHFSP